MLANLEREVDTASILYQANKHNEIDQYSASIVRSNLNREQLLDLPNFPRRFNRSVGFMPPIYITLLDEIALARVVPNPHKSVSDEMIKIEALQFIEYVEEKKGMHDTYHLGVYHQNGYCGNEVVRALTLLRPIYPDRNYVAHFSPDDEWQVEIDKTFGLSRSDKNIKDWNEYINKRAERIAARTGDLREQRYRQYLQVANLENNGNIIYKPTLVLLESPQRFHVVEKKVA